MQIMTSNGAKILGLRQPGGHHRGRECRPISSSSRGDPVADAGDIRNVETVFRKGLGFDSAKLRRVDQGARRAALVDDLFRAALGNDGLSVIHH